MAKRFRNFVLTVNNWSTLMLQALQDMDIITYGIMGEEEAPETGTKHLQGYVQLNQQQTIKSFQKKLVAAGVKCHLEGARGTFEQNYEYCTKTDEGHEWGEPKKSGKRTDLAEIADLIKDGTTANEIADLYPAQWMRYYKSFEKYQEMVEDRKRAIEEKEAFIDAELYDWQKDVLEALLDQDDREVLWIVDVVGGAGKTYLAKYLDTVHKAFYIGAGSGKDIAYAYKRQEIVVFDFTRQKQGTVNYTVIEAFKNGRIWSPKYESKVKTMKACKVVVFSNWEPDQSKLSEDRWNIKRIINYMWESDIQQIEKQDRENTASKPSLERHEAEWHGSAMQYGDEFDFMNE